MNADRRGTNRYRSRMSNGASRRLQRPINCSLAVLVAARLDRGLASSVLRNMWHGICTGTFRCRSTGASSTVRGTHEAVTRRHTTGNCKCASTPPDNNACPVRRRLVAEYGLGGNNRGHRDEGQEFRPAERRAKNHGRAHANNRADQGVGMRNRSVLRRKRRRSDICYAAHASDMQHHGDTAWPALRRGTHKNSAAVAYPVPVCTFMTLAPLI